MYYCISCSTLLPQPKPERNPRPPSPATLPSPPRRGSPRLTSARPPSTPPRESGSRAREEGGGEEEREMGSSSKVVRPEEVLDSLANDGTIDALRMKIIAQLKANVRCSSRFPLSNRFLLLLFLALLACFPVLVYRRSLLLV